MKSERPLKVVFFKTETGNEPVRDWLKSLAKEECKTIGADILTVQYAWPVGKPLARESGLILGRRAARQDIPRPASLCGPS